MEPLPPIPTPASQYWREFRIRIGPLLVLGLVVAAIVVLWRQAGISSYLPGIAEGVRSTVTSPQAGILQQLNVQPYQMVRAGDPIAIVLPRDPKVALDLLQSQLAISRLRMQPTLAEQNVMNFEQIRVDLLRTKSELEVAKANLVRAENEVRRNTPLFAEKLVSEDLYDLSVQTKAMYQAEVESKSRAIAEIEKRMLDLQGIGVPQAASSNDFAHMMITGLETMRDAAATNWGPMILRAPISGMVSFVYRQQSENVVEGEPLVAINSDWAERIVGYMRQPYTTEPQPGASVLVSTREKKSRQFYTEIAQVGAQLEIITNSLAFIRQGALVDAGLPIVLTVPKGMQIRPGETVDIVFKARPVEDGPAPLTPRETAAFNNPASLPDLR